MILVAAAELPPFSHLGTLRGKARVTSRITMMSETKDFGGMRASWKRSRSELRTIGRLRCLRIVTNWGSRIRIAELGAQN